MKQQKNCRLRNAGLLSLSLIFLYLFLFNQMALSEGNTSDLKDIVIEVNESKVEELAYGIAGDKSELTLSSPIDKWVKISLEEDVSINLIDHLNRESTFNEIPEIEFSNVASLTETKKEQNIFWSKQGEEKRLFVKLNAHPQKLEVIRESRKESIVILEDESGHSQEMIHFLSNDEESVQRNTNFSITPNISRLTGTDPMDTIDEPGYDSDKTNNRLRTFDTAAYTVQGSINMASTQYSELTIQLDSQIDDAWRLDSSGKVRQTAEIVNGEITNNHVGPYTKKSTHSSQLKINGSTGQFYFTETIQAFGGLNEDEVHTKFAITILSATTIDGKEVMINQRVDYTTEPKLQDKIYLSAKASIDVIMVTNQNQMNEFDNLVTEGSLPNTIVKGVGVYAQLKPLSKREDTTSLKGSTYPEGGIEYKIKQKIFYQSGNNSVGEELVIGEETQPVQAIYYRGGPSGGTPKYTAEFSNHYGTYTPLSEQGTKVPYGYTRNVFPPTEATANAGIFDTGFPTAMNNTTEHVMDVVNDDYLSVSTGRNKKFFTGESMPTSSEPFSVVYMQMIFPYSYLVDQTNNTGQLKYHLYIDEVSYEGQKQDVKASTDIIWDKKWPGSFVTTTAFTDSQHRGLSSIGSDSYYKSNGDGMTTQGNRVWSSHYVNGQSVFGKETVMYARWNANSFQYDTSRNILPATDVSKKHLKQLFYGVGTKVPDVNLRTAAEIEEAYTWYETIQEAEEHGEIVGIKSVFTDNNGNNAFRLSVPLIAVGPIGVLDETGQANVAYTNGFLYDVNQNLIFQNPSEKMSDYRPTEYDSEGNITHEAVDTGSWGDTLFINNILIRPVITTDKQNYNPTDTIKWTVRGDIMSGHEGAHKVTHYVTLPKETIYAAGTAKDGKGELLPDPIITEHANGTKTLAFSIVYPNLGDGNPLLTFETTIISSLLIFINNQFTLEGNVVSEIEVVDNPEIKDLSPEARRKSTTSITVSNSGSIVIDKITDKPYIESGNQRDPANPAVEHPTDINYTISYRNHSSNELTNVRILDVLPHNEDSRGTNFSGDYETLEVKNLEGKGDVWFTFDTVDVDTDPNLIDLKQSNWSKLENDMSILKNATAVMVVYPELSPGDLLSYSIKIRPDNQKASDTYVNSPTLNSNINQYVHGMATTTKVLGRELSGIAWYDDDLDGIKGTDEEAVSNVPVKLYRWSQENPDYKNELVKTSLTGERFIDEMGNSLIKTNSDGEYVFNNLPEGNYVVEFDVLEEVRNGQIQITEALVGSDFTKNSKANVETGRTLDYLGPRLQELPSQVDDTSKFLIEDVNIGLIRPSEITLYKYAKGTEKGDNPATGKGLSGAEFELYEAKTNTKIAEGKTDKSGWLTFSEVFPGNYYLVETKSPNGFELLKKKINVTIKKGNETIVLYQDDQSQTKLPFTGSNSRWIILLSISMSSILLGLIVIILNRRREK